MDSERVAAVRRFNRTVTSRVGALDDEYMAQGRPLGQARLLWEIGPGGAEVAALRGRLGLDSGYTSRLLRILETDGLITVESAPSGDGRVRTARLTPAGETEWAALDGKSDALAWSILEPLDDGRRTRLVAAMSEVERLLMASMVRIEVCAPADPRARACVRAYARDLAVRVPGGFDPALSRPVRDAELTPPAGALLLATLGSEAVGCGAVKLHPGGDGFAEIKRVWVSDTVRGLGVGRRLLSALERHAAEHGHREVRLDTNRNLTEAIALYRSAGYTEIPAYNDEHYADFWFAKALRQ